MITIDAAFDGGNIECLSAERADDIRLSIRPDGQAAYFQWFFFRIGGARGQAVTCRLVNAAEASYPHGWPDYQAVVSDDRVQWRRTVTRYRDGVLEIDLTPTGDAAWVAFFAPFTADDEARLLGRALASPLVGLSSLGRTLDGRPLDLLTIGTAGPGKRVLWITARQHAGETMGGYWVEGFLGRLLAQNDLAARNLLAGSVIHLVPNANPDGARRGHLRANAAGTDLNRQWLAPTMTHSPEVCLILQRMTETGVDFLFDVHGDESEPHNYLIGSHAMPGHSPAMSALFDRYVAALAAASPDYFTDNGGWKPTNGPNAPTLCSLAIAERFRCLSMTLEMPFQDEMHNPDPVHGWSPERSRALGAACLDAMAAVLPVLREA